MWKLAIFRIILFKVIMRRPTRMQETLEAMDSALRAPIETKLFINDCERATAKLFWLEALDAGSSALLFDEYHTSLEGCWQYSASLLKALQLRSTWLWKLHGDGFYLMLWIHSRHLKRALQRVGCINRIIRNLPCIFNYWKVIKIWRASAEWLIDKASKFAKE